MKRNEKRGQNSTTLFVQSQRPLVIQVFEAKIYFEAEFTENAQFAWLETTK